MEKENNPQDDPNSNIENNQTAECEDVSTDIPEAEQSVNPDKDVEFDINSSIESTQQYILEEIKTLTSLFNKRLTRDDVKEKAFNQLYNEYQNLKQDKSFESIKPTIIDLMLLYDRLDNKLTNIDSDNKEFIQSVRDELLEILIRRDIHLIQRTDLVFNPSIQKAIGTKETDSKELNNKIYSYVRAGFQLNNKVLRPEEVIVYKYIEDNNSDKPQKEAEEL